MKWAGGKRQLLPAIIPNLPDDFGERRYFEPFVGAGALFLNRRPREAVINDYNSQLIDTYIVIRDDIESLINELDIHERNNCKDYFYQIRGLDRDKKLFDSMTKVQKSARLIYLNKTCYNGLYRVNSKGLFNAPYGRYSNPTILDEPALRAVNRYLAADWARIAILNGDFEAAVAGAGPDSFVYFDPPYHSLDKTNFTAYRSEGFGEADQLRLRDVFARLTGEGARCLLSNSDTPFIRSVYDDRRYEVVSVSANRAINSVSGGRGRVGEVLIKNWRGAG